MVREAAWTLKLSWSAQRSGTTVTAPLWRSRKPRSTMDWLSSRQRSAVGSVFSMIRRPVNRASFGGTSTPSLIGRTSRTYAHLELQCRSLACFERLYNNRSVHELRWFVHRKPDTADVGRGPLYGAPAGIVCWSREGLPGARP